MKNILIACILMISISCNTLKYDVSSPVIQLTKKRCLGKCPVYDLMIYENGLLTYNGIDYVSKKGIHQFKISSESFENLNQLFKDSKFSKIEDKRKKGRDLPITQISYQNKKVSFQGQNMPEKVKEIVNRIEELVGI